MKILFLLCNISFIVAIPQERNQKIHDEEPSTTGSGSNSTTPDLTVVYAETANKNEITEKPQIPNLGPESNDSRIHDFMGENSDDNDELFRTNSTTTSMTTTAQCLKITQNVAFKFFDFGIFHQFLSY